MVLVGAWVGHPAGAQGYKGHIGCEYHPRGKTEDGLKWLDELVEWLKVGSLPGFCTGLSQWACDALSGEPEMWAQDKQSDSASWFHVSQLLFKEAGKSAAMIPSCIRRPDSQLGRRMHVPPELLSEVHWPVQDIGGSNGNAILDSVGNEDFRSIPHTSHRNFRNGYICNPAFSPRSGTVENLLGFGRRLCCSHFNACKQSSSLAPWLCTAQDASPNEADIVCPALGSVSGRWKSWAMVNVSSFPMAKHHPMKIGFKISMV